MENIDLWNTEERLHEKGKKKRLEGSRTNILEAFLKLAQLTNKAHDL